MKTKHTPTPMDYNGELLVVKSIQTGYAKRVIATMEDYPEWEQDANFIVRAVNSHEALLKAAKAVSDKGCHGISGDEMRALKKAVTQAEGGEL